MRTQGRNGAPKVLIFVDRPSKSAAELALLTLVLALRKANTHLGSEGFVSVKINSICKVN